MAISLPRQGHIGRRSGTEKKSSRNTVCGTGLVMTMINDDEYRRFASDQKISIMAAGITPVTLTLKDGRKLHLRLEDLIDDQFAGMDLCAIDFNTHEIDDWRDEDE